MKKGFAHIILIAVLAATLAIFGFVYFKSLQTTPYTNPNPAHTSTSTATQSATKKADETTNWETLKSFIDSNGNKKYVIHDRKRINTKDGSLDYTDKIYISSSEKSISPNAVMVVDMGIEEVTQIDISANAGTKYLVFDIHFPDGNELSLYDENGKHIGLDISKLGLETNIHAQHRDKFKNWIGSSTQFIISDSSATGHSFEGTFDATTGKQVGGTKQIN